MRKILAALALVATVAAVAASGASAKATTECNGTYSNTTLKSVVVKNGDSCTLINVVIKDGLDVKGGGGGAYLDLEGSTINGGFSMSGGSYPALLYANNNTIRGGMLATGNIWTPSYFCGNSISGGINLKNMETFGYPVSFGEANAGCAGGTISGGAEFENVDSAGVEVDGYTVNGGILFSGDSGFNEMEADTVNGMASCVSTVANDGDGGANTYNGSNSGCPA